MNLIALAHDLREPLADASERKTLRVSLPDGFEETYGGAVFGPKSDIPILRLGHGRTVYDRVYWSGHALDNGSQSWGRRCLVPVQSLRVTDVDLGGDGVSPAEFRDMFDDWFYLAGVWGTLSEHSFESGGFALLSSGAPEDSPFEKSLLVVPRNLAVDWLNPAKDSRRLSKMFEAPPIWDPNALIGEKVA